MRLSSFSAANGLDGILTSGLVPLLARGAMLGLFQCRERLG